MISRLIALSALALTLASCATAESGPVSVVRTNAVEARWKGQSAGPFFAQFGPPASDVESGDQTLYTWRGGRRDNLGNGKRGPWQSCSVQLTVSSDYTIRSVRILGDRPTSKGRTVCEDLLAPQSQG
ncbi:hypothetical protein BJF93_08065 [Xaviernesmea oryzae]|uniref:Uncharacterized protein n=1 Tax=Xaviernesmea oryzae TaxID=464029 RepID=A0A1Q9B0R0_9HYPH|nr:hypothetical protein [Xaviernesmea oryzae]OLP61565.1 hypothetical protein BJF93_08065 [Xaviernesmea oryzae]SEL08200.1 hypothetical protein SAMN04487976_105313 [Xaviernesmea oryzae]